MLFDLNGVWLAMLMTGEFSLHFVIDHFKAIHARKRPAAAFAAPGGIG